MNRRLAVLALAVVASASLALAAPSLGSSADALLVSGPNGTTAAGFPAEQHNPAISGDGLFVAFVGSVGETGDGLYLRDMRAGIVPVDIPHGASEHGIEFAAGSPSLSGTGRYLAFASEDPAVSDEDRDSSTTPAGDTFPVRDVFVYDRMTGAVSLVSRANGLSGAAGNEDSDRPSISADGRYVAFDTQATDFLHGVFGGLYVRDLRTERTTLVGRENGRSGKPLRTALNPSISAHGSRVAFVSSHPVHGSVLEIAVRDLKTNRTAFASRASGARGALARERCVTPVISANGRYVAFASKAKNLSRNDRDEIEDIFVRDLKTSRTELVSRAEGKHGAAAGGDSSNPSISANGRYVAFESYASNLGPTDNSTVPDVFVRDMRSGRVFLASKGADGPANAPSADPAISADGRFVAFDSRGSNLDPADPLHATSVFRYRLLP